MRVRLNSICSNSKPAALVLGFSVLLLGAAPVFAQVQQDILLPPPDASPTVTETPTFVPVPAPEDPASMTAPVENDPAAAAAAEDAMDDLLKKIDAGAAPVQPAATPTVPEITPEIVTETPAVAPPSEAKLADPVVAPAPVKAAPTVVGEIPAIPPSGTVDENLFFDADTLVPTGAMGVNAPRKVNPSLEPASKLIVVKKDYEPSARQAQMVSAERAVKLGRYDAALELYNGLYEKNKRDPNVLMGRAIALQHLNQDDEAVQMYEALLDLHPDNVEAQVNMLGLMGQKYPAVSLQRLRELHDHSPNNVAIVGQMAVLQANVGDYDEAFKYLGMAASLEPHNANHLFNLAVIADRAGKKDDAVKYYEQALEIDSIYNGGSSIPREAVYERLAHIR